MASLIEFGAKMLISEKQPTGLFFKNVALVTSASKRIVGEITDYRVSHRFPLICDFLFHLLSQSANLWNLHTH